MCPRGVENRKMCTLGRILVDRCWMQLSFFSATINSTILTEDAVVADILHPTSVVISDTHSDPIHASYETIDLIQKPYITRCQRVDGGYRPRPWLSK